MIKKKKARPSAKQPKLKTKTRKKALAKRSKKLVSKRAQKSIIKAGDVTLERIGKVTHYFPKVRAAAIKLKKSGLQAGDEIYAKGQTTDFKDIVSSIQLERRPIKIGRKGQEIGLLVKSRVRIGDSIYKAK